MFRIGRMAVVGAAVSAALLLTPSATLAANPGAGVVVGSGTISPPLTTVNQNVTGGFGGTLVGAGVVGTTPAGGTGTCTFSFHSNPPGDNIGTGQGAASGSCNASGPGLATLTVSVATDGIAYTRAGAVVVITGSGTANGVAVTITATCVFVPTSNPPSTFNLVCAVVLS
jgi:hypothetical protein